MRWRVKTGLAETGLEPVARAALLTEVAGLPEVARWLENLGPQQGIRLGTVHGSFDTCFENAVGKLVTLGLGAGIEMLDSRVRPHRVWLASQVFRPTGHVFDVFERALVASLLATAGYGGDAAVREQVRSRLDTVSGFVQDGRYDIYDEPSRHKGVPEIWRNRPVIHPDLYPFGEFALPWIYDMYAFAALMPTLSPEDRQKVRGIVDYVLDPRYQGLSEGYGIIASGGRRYHAMGWDVRLPLPGAPATSAFQMGYWLQRLDLMASFEEARASPWFAASMDHLECFATPQGAYSFPRMMIKEEKGYWITGSHMGLGENRRSRGALEIESTFWAQKIKRGAGRM